MRPRNLNLDACGVFRYPCTALENIIREFTSVAPPRVDTFMLTAKTIIDQGAKNLVETGCYRGNQVDGCSTLVLAAVAMAVGGHLDSYELDPNNIRIASNILKRNGLIQYVTFHQGDSITELAKRTEPIGFAYLDSYDCGLASQRPAQEHQLAELEAVLPLLTPKASILLDDYTETRGGKPKLAMRRLLLRKFKLLAHQYQLLFASDDTKRLRKHRFAVICCHDERFAGLAARTIYKNKGIYCLEHDYDLRVERSVRQKFVDPKSHASGFSWSRLEAMRDLVASGNYEWVWCIGTDTLITNMQVSLESIVDEVPSDKHVVIAGERVAPRQADSFLVRCSPQGVAWLQDLLGAYEAYRHHPWVENQVMIDRIPQHEAVTYVIPQHRINSYQYDLYYPYGEIYKDHVDCFGHRGNWERGDFVVHWPGTTLEKRLELVPQYEPKIVPPHMKISIVFTRILGKGCNLAPPPSYYAEPTYRWLETYKKFKPIIPHEVVIVNCNPGEYDSMFDEVATRYIDYHGHGWDCGTYQHAAEAIEADLIICFNAFTYFWQEDWLTPFVNAARDNGPGIYGPTGSYENTPHLRTPCIGFHPGVMREYPHLSNSRETCILFESGPDNFTMWSNKAGYPTLMVTRDKAYPMNEWRTPNNVFRRGDQSNCLIKDRHTDLYDKASPEEKVAWANAADTRR